MKKLKIEIPLILPEVRTKKTFNACQELISMLQEQKRTGKSARIQKLLIMVYSNFVFIIDPELISTGPRTIHLSGKPGVSRIPKKIAHKLIEVEGIRHPRHARGIERNLRDLNGMIEASVSASGMVRVEFDRSQLDEATIIKALQKEGLDIPDTAVNAENIYAASKKQRSRRKTKSLKRSLNMKKVM